MSRRLYRAAEKYYRDVRGLIHRETWGQGSVERLLVDTERGLVDVLRIPDHTRNSAKRSRHYTYGEPLSWHEARLALVAAYESQLQAAQADGDTAVVERMGGRVSELAAAFLAAHPAYAGVPRSEPPAR